ncbi:GTP cyclohydrolase I [Streptomyces rimosus]|uniref:GTP cyclohydrolase I n=1 Tax=Streptomyces rimosus TaxID=1927 RepID=UPI000AFEC1F0|nr:GTP cyclohydrolase I [Streptomyces rimosus]
MSSVVVINPVKSGVKYKKAVKDRGPRLISVYAFNEELLEKRWPDHADGDDISLYARDAEGVLERLEPYRDDVRAVLSGNDSSVDLADHLAHALGLPGNCVELACARNHEDVMRRVAEQAGLRSKFARIAHKHAHKLQVQERLVSDIADEIADITGTDDLAVVGRGNISV